MREEVDDQLTGRADIGGREKEDNAMDDRAFDRLARLLGGVGTRRGALGFLLATGLAGGAGTTIARRKHHGRASKRPPGKGAPVKAQGADCGNPGPGANLNGCHFEGRDLSGKDLSGSRLVAAKFARANLCSADLSSSNLKNADFTGANLTRADLGSSSCKGIRFDAATTFCRTIACDGTIRDDDCPAGVDPAAVCCDDDDCAAGQTCDVARGVCGCPPCPPCTICNGSGQCVPCPGCCDAAGACQPGASIAACGEGGGTCRECLPIVPSSFQVEHTIPQICQAGRCCIASGVVVISMFSYTDPAQCCSGSSTYHIEINSATCD
jgi:hypothetical protein